MNFKSFQTPDGAHKTTAALCRVMWSKFNFVVLQDTVKYFVIPNISTKSIISDERLFCSKISIISTGFILIKALEN